MVIEDRKKLASVCSRAIELLGEGRRWCITWDEGTPDGDRQTIAVAKFIDGKTIIVGICDTFEEAQRIAMGNGSAEAGDAQRTSNCAGDDSALLDFVAKNEPWVVKPDGTKESIDPSKIFIIDQDDEKFLILDGRPAVRAAGAIRALKRLKEKFGMKGDEAATIERVIHTLTSLTPQFEKEADSKFRNALVQHTAQLRHAHNSLQRCMVEDPKKFADTFLAPVIRWMEQIADGRTAE